MFSSVNGLSIFTSPENPAGWITWASTQMKPTSWSSPGRRVPRVRIHSAPLRGLDVEIDIAIKCAGLGIAEVPREIDILHDDAAAGLEHCAQVRKRPGGIW